MERKLDWTMTRKKMEIQDSFVKVAMVCDLFDVSISVVKLQQVPRTLRVFLSHFVEGQVWQNDAERSGTSLDANSLDFASGQGIPSWTFKIEGRLLNPVSSCEKLCSAPPFMKFYSRMPAPVFPCENLRRS